jgi:type II secretory pathway pseudopilin PulG
MKPAPIRRPQPSEEGYMLVAVIFLVALLTISLAVALPRISKEIQRDREIETMHRGKQYIRGIRMYYKKFGAYPPNVDALLKGTNNIRFLRKKYTDPTTGKEDWKPIHFGQNKAPTAMGFFGVPLGGSTIAGTGPGATSPGFNPSATTPPVDPNAPPVDPNNPNAATPAAGQPVSPGQTFGGVGIIGFSPNSPRKSILIYKTKDHYNEWEFVYDPIVEQMMMQGGNTGLGSNNSLGGNTGISGSNAIGGSNGIGGNTGIGGNSGGNTTPPPASQ